MYGTVPTLQSTNVTEILDRGPARPGTTDLDRHRRARHICPRYILGNTVATHNEQKHGQHLLQSTAMTISGFTTSDDLRDDLIVITQVVNKKAATRTRTRTVLVP